jgi:hypothetical protein
MPERTGSASGAVQDVVFAAVAHPAKAEEDSLAGLRGLILKSISICGLMSLTIGSSVLQ